MVMKLRMDPNRTMIPFRVAEERRGREVWKALSLRHASQRSIEFARMHRRRWFRLGHACIWILDEILECRMNQERQRSYINLQATYESG